MTSEQRNEIAMEVLDEVLTEATRYAKELHRKNENTVNTIKKYKEMRLNLMEKIKNAKTYEERKKLEDKMDKIVSKEDKLKIDRIMMSYHDPKSKLFNPLHNEVDKFFSTSDKNESKRGSLATHPGRYQYGYPRSGIHEEPGFYKK